MRWELSVICNFLSKKLPHLTYASRACLKKDSAIASFFLDLERIVSPLIPIKIKPLRRWNSGLEQLRPCNFDGVLYLTRTSGLMNFPKNSLTTLNWISCSLWTTSSACWNSVTYSFKVMSVDQNKLSGNKVISFL